MGLFDALHRGHSIVINGFLNERSTFAPSANAFISNERSTFAPSANAFQCNGVLGGAMAAHIALRS